jgi:hypothetical protein
MKKPDWKNEEDYEHVTIETIGADGVAWEFLRRNQAYQTDYEALRNGTVTDAEGNPPQAVKPGIFLHGPKTGFFVPPLKPDQGHRAWLSEEPGRRILSPADYLATKWKVDALCDPQKSALELKPEFTVPQHPRIITEFDDLDELEAASDPGEDQEVDVPIPLSPNNIVVVFSLNEKITPQWKRIRENLVALQSDYSISDGHKSTSSPKWTAWISALRAWDSMLVAAELPNNERAAILYGEKSWQNVSKFNSHIETATRLIAGDYLEIARQGW